MTKFGITISELANIRKAAERWEEMALFGGVLYVGEVPVAMTMASAVSPQCIDVHFEKAEINLNGAYPMVCRELTRMLMQRHPELVYINREDDMGLEPLRRSKLSYKPEYLLEKYIARWQDA